MFQQQQLDNHKKLNEQKTSLKHLSTSSNIRKKIRLVQLFFPTRIKLHQPPLNEQVPKLNQRAINVEQSISSLHTQRLEYLTFLNEKIRDLERATAAFEYSSSKNLTQKLDKIQKLSYIFKIAITLCLTLFSFMLTYMIIQLIRDKSFNINIFLG